MMRQLYLFVLFAAVWCVITHPEAAVAGRSYAPAEAQPVWRFWSPVYRRHFYTISTAERDKLLSQYPGTWTYEGVAWRAFASPGSDMRAPVWRFWSGRLRAHFYTIDENERSKLVNDYPGVWTYEGIAFYAYPSGSQPAGTMPVWRFWSGALRTHFYTDDDTERFKLIGGYSDLWDDEGIAWHVLPAEADSLAAVVAGPYLEQTAPDSVTITWQTNVPADGYVRYGKAGTSELSVSQSGLSRLHRISLPGLVPDSVYDYRAVSGGDSRTGVFTTMPRVPRPFRFAVYGDSRTYPETHEQVAIGIIHSAPEVVFHTGDMVGSGRDYRAWKPEYFYPARNLMRNVPVIPVPGNHEYAGTGAPWFFYYFARPLGQAWFAMTVGNTRFVGLDTSVAYAPGSAQHEWLVRELESADCRSAAWRIVILHEPAFTCTSGHSDNTAVQSHLVPLFEQYGVQLAFQGHSHAYERYLHHGIHYIVTGGGGGPLYPLVPDTVAPIRQFGASVYHHCVVDVDPFAGTLTVTAVDLLGEVFDTITLSEHP